MAVTAKERASFLLRMTWSGANLILASHIPGQCQRKTTRKTAMYAMPCTGNFIRDKPVDFTKCGPNSNEMRLSASVSISHVQVPKKVSEGESVGYF